MQPGFRLTSANGSIVTAICRRLDALPLALELAAPWLKVLTADDLLRRLTRDVLLSSVGPRDLPERQQTINATVSWSYQLLGPSEQRVFRRLGALPGRFSIEAAAAVLAGSTSSMASGEALGAVALLIDRSLVLRAETSTTARPLYEMLETVRAYAALELGAAGERDEAMEGLARYCLREASLAAEGMLGPAQIEWLDRVRDELDCYRGALAWLIERARPAEASAIASGLMAFWLMRGHLSEGLQWYEQTLQLPSLSPADESRALLGAAVMSYARGQLEHAEALATRAIAIARRADDHAVVLIADNRRLTDGNDPGVDKRRPTRPDEMKPNDVRDERRNAPRRARRAASRLIVMHGHDAACRTSANHDRPGHPWVDRAVIGKGSRGLERCRELSAGRRDSRIPPRGVRGRRVRH